MEHGRTLPAWRASRRCYQLASSRWKSVEADAARCFDRVRRGSWCPWRPVPMSAACGATRTESERAIIMDARSGRAASVLSIVLVGGLAACSSTSENPASGGTSGSSGATATGGSSSGGVAGATSSGGSAGAAGSGGTGSTGGVGGTTFTGGTGGAGGSAGSSCTEPPSAPSGNCAGAPATGTSCKDVGTCCAKATLFQCKCDGEWHETTFDSQCCPSNPASVGPGKACSTAAGIICCSTSFQAHKCSGGVWAATGAACQ